MRKLLVPLLLAAALALPAAGCARLQKAFEVITAAEAFEVNETAVNVAANSFNALQATATNYLVLPRCAPKTEPVCRDPEVTKKLIRAVRSGRIARDKLVTFSRENPGQLGSTGLYNALLTATDTLKSIIALYKIEK